MALGRTGEKALRREKAKATARGSFLPAPHPHASCHARPAATTTDRRYESPRRIAQTPNEVIIDFGINPNFFGQILDEPLKLDSRVVLSHDAAKRLCIHLTATIQTYEDRYGTIELDVTKRLKPAAAI
jgi:hypothetical protein